MAEARSRFRTTSDGVSGVEKSNHGITLAGNAVKECPFSSSSSSSTGFGNVWRIENEADGEDEDEKARQIPSARIKPRINNATTTTAKRLAAKGLSPVCFIEANFVSSPTPAMLMMMQNLEICSARVARLT